jgi:hypothetical protein
MTALGRAFDCRRSWISLLSIGSSICGVSAIIAAKGDRWTLRRCVVCDGGDSGARAASLFVFPVAGQRSA